MGSNMENFPIVFIFLHLIRVSSHLYMQADIFFEFSVLVASYVNSDPILYNINQFLLFVSIEHFSAYSEPKKVASVSWRWAENDTNWYWS